MVDTGFLEGQKAVETALKSGFSELFVLIAEQL